MKESVNKDHSIRLRLALAVCACTLAGSSNAVTWQVLPDGSGEAATIQGAIELAEEGDSILVAPGTYIGDGNRDLELRGKAIALIGTAGPAATIIDCQGREGDPHRGFHLHEKEKAETLIEGFTITGGYAEGKYPACYGGAIFCTYSSPTIHDVWMIGNRSAHFGGAMVCFKYASPMLERVRFINNEAVNNGGGFGSKMQCRPILKDALFIGNKALRGGAFWCWRAGATIENATFYGNSAELMAAAIWMNEAEVTLHNSIIAYSEGADLASCTSPPPEVRMVNCNIFGNDGGDEVPRCIIDGGGNFHLDPQFVNPGKGDFSLRSDSPCAAGKHPGSKDAGTIGALTTSPPAK